MSLSATASRRGVSAAGMMVGRERPNSATTGSNQVRRPGRAAPGSLEQAALEALWDHGGWLTPGEVHDRLGRNDPLGYTTVMTVLVRLWKKGRVDRQKAGRAFAYRPTLTREQYVAERMEAILTTAGDRPGALGYFVERLADAERAQLQRLLNVKRKR